MLPGVDGWTRPRQIVVIGGGAAGVICTAHLLRRADPDHPIDVTVIERSETVGPGLAYRTTRPIHTLNNFAGRLSAIDGDPNHLLRWCRARGIPATPTTFLRRHVYGAYLTDVLADTAVPEGSRLRRIRGEAVDVSQDAEGLVVQLSCGWRISTDKVVLALGNPPPRRLRDMEGHGSRYLPDPWSEDLIRRARGAREILLVGTGLTMVDLAAQLHEALPGTRFTAVSRSGLLPTAHRRGSLRLHDTFNPGAAGLDTVIERVRERMLDLAEVGGDWRDVVDSVRACANELWSAFSPEDQDRFVSQLARHWEVSRHRMSPDMAAHVEGLREAGVLRICRVGEVEPAQFDRVINCTGPSPVPTRGWSRLVDTLLDRGTIRPHRLGLGLDLTPDGNVVDSTGEPRHDLYAVGAARRGVEWEVAAVPDLRTQATKLAEAVLGTGDPTVDRRRRPREAASA